MDGARGVLPGAIIMAIIGVVIMDMCGMTLGIIPISMAIILVGTMDLTTDTILTLGQ